MSINNSVRPLLEQEADGTKENTRTASSSLCKDNTDDKQTQPIFDLLPQGEANAIPSATLAMTLGLRSVRELQHQVAEERAAGALILSTCKGGYFRPSEGETGKQEIARFAQTLRARAVHTLAALKAARLALEGVDGQLDIEGLEAV